MTPKFWLSFAAKLLFCREHGEEGAWHHNIQPAYKAVGEYKEAQIHGPIQLTSRRSSQEAVI